ncbi:dTDP-4-dehydrorhamnose 3,5-epimerase family protein, partial [Patescibacteria group bacterium]|nr:dTDP-4-dehydrorhamnose 3,5-epimerase family protein [Patescibacteria group bacterium]
SKTFKQWLSLTLSAAKQEMVYVPPGYAHGFLTLSGQAEVLYYCTDEYAPELERGIIWNDPELAIDWPIQSPQLSEKDTEYPSLAQAEYNF